MEQHSENKHVHGGKSSQGLFDPSRVLEAIGLKGGDVFLDAGCGDGYISIPAAQVVGSKGKVFAVDNFDESISNLEREIGSKKIENLMAILADVTVRIPLKDRSIDVVLISNMLHGFVANREMEAVMIEINRVLKPGGVLGVVDFKKIEGTPGPPMSIRLTWEESINIIAPHGYQIKTRDADVGLYSYAISLTKK